MKGRRITLLIFGCMVSAIVICQKCNGQANDAGEKNFKVEYIYDFEVKKGLKVNAGVRIANNKIYLNAVRPFYVFEIKRMFEHKGNLYYDIQSDTCIGFFVIRPDEHRAILLVYMKEMGHYQASYSFVKEK